MSKGGRAIDCKTVKKQAKGRKCARIAGRKQKRGRSLRGKVVDTAGGTEGSLKDGGVGDEIVGEHIVQATADVAGMERGVSEVRLFYFGC